MSAPIPTTVATSICLDCQARPGGRRGECGTCGGRDYVAFDEARTRWPSGRVS